MNFIPIGFVRSAYQQTSDVPKGFGARHDAEGVLDIQPEFEDGLTDIEGFSHLYVIWVFDRSDGFELLGVPPTDDRPHGVFATRSPKRPNPIGLIGRRVAAARRLSPARARPRHARRHANPRHQAVSVERASRHPPEGLVGRGGAQADEEPVGDARSGVDRARLRALHDWCGFRYCSPPPIGASRV